jgi:hypothetical protein
MPSLYESLRESLLKLGPTHPVLRSAIRLQARASGFKGAASDEQLALSKGARRMLLRQRSTLWFPTRCICGICSLTPSLRR